MNYNYANIKIKAVDVYYSMKEDYHTDKVNQALKEIQDKGYIVENLQSIYIKDNGIIRTIITYREIKVKEEQK